MAGVVDARRRAAAAQAAEARLLADAVGLVAERTALLRQEAQQRGGSVRASDADLPLREVALELAMALRVSDRGVQRRMSEAYLLTTLFPRTFEVWAGGEIDAAHAWAISRTGTLLTTEEDRGRYETLALEAARSESPARMTAAAKAIAATIDPTAFTEAAQRAYEERSVRLFPLEDGMARLIADLPAPLAHAIHDTLTARGRAILDQTDEDSDGEADVTSRPRTVIDDAGVRTTAAGGASDTRRGETLITSRAPATGPARPTDVTCTTTTTATAVKDSRTLDQVRADILTDLLLTATASTRATGAGAEAVTAQIQVTVPALTLAGDPDGGPALLTGYGPIDPAIARRLAGLAPGWDRVFTDPATGIPVAVDRYRPSAEIRRYLAARDERCRTPGCTRPTHRCDHDHTTPASHGGHTAPDNLAHLCRRHHTVKHHTAWQVRHLGHGTLHRQIRPHSRHTGRATTLLTPRVAGASGVLFESGGARCRGEREPYDGKMDFLAAPVLGNEFVRVEPLSAAHRADLVDAVRVGNVWEAWYTHIPSPDEMSGTIEKRLAAHAEGSMVPWAVIDAASDRAVGMTSYLNIEPTNRRLEIGGTWLGRNAQGTGINPAAKLLLLSRAFDDLGCGAVEFRAHWHNRQSRTAIEKLGAKQDGVLRNHTVFENGTIRDTVVYSIIDGEWPTVKYGLQERLNALRSTESSR